MTQEKDPRLEIFGISGEMPNYRKAMEKRSREDILTSAKKEPNLRKSPTTFFARVNGSDVRKALTDNNDLIVIDKTVTPFDNCLAVCWLDGEFVLKRVEKQPDGVVLKPAYGNSAPIRVTNDNEFIIWGVVTCTVQREYPCM